MTTQDDIRLRKEREMRLNGFYEVMNRYSPGSVEVRNYVVATMNELSQEEGDRFVRTAAMALLLRTQTDFTEVDVGSGIAKKVE